MQSQKILFQEAFYDLLSECADYLSEQGFSVECRCEWNKQKIVVIPFYLRRIINNIMSNIENYADKQHAVWICTIETERYFGFSFENCKYENRNASGNCIGLLNLRSMMKQMEGVAMIEESANFFELKLLFQKVS